MKTGNKGNWSEIYAIFKILADGKLALGDAELKIIKDLYYPIISILKKESSNNINFIKDNANIVVSSNNKDFIIPVTEFISQAKYLLDQIKNSTASFSIPQTEAFLNSFGSESIGADSTTKADILITVHDDRTSLERTLGFSIKSQIGSPSTLLNASSSTNFIFKILGNKFQDKDMVEINKIDSNKKIRDRITAIYKKGYYLEYESIENLVFRNNLILIDSLLPLIIANSILIYYKDNKHTLNQICTELIKINPNNYDQTTTHKFYDHKLKRFLSEVALGMVPTKVWSGQYDGTEGYVVVKEDGEIVCYHIINRNLFEGYLFNNTKFDTPSSTRHKFGEIYEKNSEYFFKLNFQIRFD